jgi:hypothetical protein
MKSKGGFINIRFIFHILIYFFAAQWSGSPAIDMIEIRLHKITFSASWPYLFRAK